MVALVPIVVSVLSSGNRAVSEAAHENEPRLAVPIVTV